MSPDECKELEQLISELRLDVLSEDLRCRLMNFAGWKRDKRYNNCGLGYKWKSPDGEEVFNVDLPNPFFSRDDSFKLLPENWRLRSVFYNSIKDDWEIVIYHKYNEDLTLATRAETENLALTIAALKAILKDTVK